MLIIIIIFLFFFLIKSISEWKTTAAICFAAQLLAASATAPTCNEGVCAYFVFSLGFLLFFFRTFTIFCIIFYYLPGRCNALHLKCQSFHTIFRIISITISISGGAADVAAVDEHKYENTNNVILEISA